MNKVINSERFFGFECPENQIMSDLRLLGTGEGSVLNNNPTAVSCCELGGYSKVTDNCIDSFSNAAGGRKQRFVEETVPWWQFMISLIQHCSRASGNTKVQKGSHVVISSTTLLLEKTATLELTVAIVK